MTGKSLAIAVAIAVVLTTTVVGAGRAEAIPESPALRQPVFGTDVREPGIRNFPDPTLLNARSRWFAFATNSLGLDARNISVSRSTDLWNWSSPNGVGQSMEALPTPPAWAVPLTEGGSFWAPSAIRIRDRYVLYFAARHRDVPVDRSGWCIGAAWSTTPGGPYIPVRRPVVCRVLRHNQVSAVSRAPSTNRGLIDPFVYRAPDGRLYLAAKPLQRGWQLVSMRLSRDGLSTVGPAHGLLYLDAHELTWEYSQPDGFTVLENPALDYNVAARNTDQPYVLFYSGGGWGTASYSTGYATCVSPLGPCKKVTTSRAWLTRNRGVLGPGGFSVARAADGQRWASYHSWANQQVGSPNGRRMHVEPLTYQGADPVLQNRSPSGSFTATVTGPNTVAFAGTARDRDTGRPPTVAVMEGEQAIARVTTFLGAYQVVKVTVPAGVHEYCAVVRDDHVAEDTTTRCHRVVVEDPAPVG